MPMERSFTSLKTITTTTKPNKNHTQVIMKASPAHQHKCSGDDHSSVSHHSQVALAIGLEHRVWCPSSFALCSHCTSVFPDVQYCELSYSIRLFLPLSKVIQNQQATITWGKWILRYQLSCTVLPFVFLPFNTLLTAIGQLLQVKLIHLICLGTSSTCRG